jgi:hypothetical protein
VRTASSDRFAKGDPARLITNEGGIHVLTAPQLHRDGGAECLLTAPQIDTADDSTASAVEAAKLFLQDPGGLHLSISRQVLIPEFRGQIGFGAGNRNGGCHRGVSVAVDQIMGSTSTFTAEKSHRSCHRASSLSTKMRNQEWRKAWEISASRLKSVTGTHQAPEKLDRSDLGL